MPKCGLALLIQKTVQEVRTSHPRELPGFLDPGTEVEAARYGRDLRCDFAFYFPAGFAF